MARPIKENLTERPQENLTEQLLLEGSGEKENFTVCAPLKGEFHGPYDARIEDFFDLSEAK